MARPPKFDDEVILDRATRLFWRRGWSATSIRDLEAELQLTAPAIYRRFGSKDGIARAVLEHYVDRVVERRVRKYLTGDGDPIENLRSFFASGVRPPLDGGPLLGCLLTVTATDTARPGPGLDEVLVAGFDVIESGIRRELERADGSLAPGRTVDDLLVTLALAWQGLMVMARSGVASAELERRVDVLIGSITAP